MKDLEESDVVFTTCKHCNNEVTCAIQAKYRQEIMHSEEGWPDVTVWQILECRRCNGLMLLQTYLDGPSVRYGKSTIIYPRPTVNARLVDVSAIPVSIRKEYETTLSVQGISSNACAVMARRTLEAIAQYEKAPGKTLSDKVDNLLKFDRIPRLLADVAHLGRQIGNLGAHFDEEDVTEIDIEIMLEFLESILEYLYVIPEKVDVVKARLNKSGNK